MAEGREVYRSDKGVPRMPWLAVQFSLAGDNSCYSELHRGIMMQAIRFSDQFDWPRKVVNVHGHRQFYFAELAELVLDADRYKEEFTKYPELGAWCLNIPEDHWRASMSARYAMLKNHYDGWLNHALGMIRRWMREDERPAA